MKPTIQEQLKARKLKPSENSWEVLEARLEQHHKQGSSKKVVWLYVASIAAAFAILFNIFDQTSAEPTIPKEQTVETTDAFEAPDSDPVQQNTVNESELISMPSERVESPVEAVPEPERKQERIATNSEQNNEVILQTSEELTAQDMSLEAPVTIRTEGIAQVDVAEVTENELDLLLKDAQVTMAMRKQREQRKADADWLLVEVEMELDQNFKDKVFDAIKNAVKNPKNTITRRDY